MKKESNKGLIVLVIVLSLLVVGLSSYLIYDKVIDNDIENNNNIIDNNNSEEDNKFSLEMLNLDKLSKYKNYDGKYGEIKGLTFKTINESYYLSLTVDGKVYIHNNNNGNKGKLEIDNIVDIVSFSNNLGDQYYCYMLTSLGDVYYYQLNNALENNYTVVKVEDVSSVKRLIEISWAPLKNAGGAWSLVAITSNDEYIELGRGSV